MHWLLGLEDILWWAVLIGVMINIHELGHFWMARLFDVRIETFSFGFGPRLFGFRRGETDYRFSLIPFGGYVKMAGEQMGTPGEEGDEKAAQDPRSVLAKPRWQRLLISFAGPFMNVVLAVAVLTGMYMVQYPKLSPADMAPVIGGVVPGSPAAKAGIQPGDRIVQIDNKTDPTWEDVSIKEETGAYRPMRVAVERGGRRVEATVTPTLDETLGVGSAGWAKQGEVQIYRVEQGMPADKAGLKAGDIILAANGQPVKSTIALSEITKASDGAPVSVEYVRKGQTNTVSIRPVFENKETPARWMIGVAPGLKTHIVNTSLSLPDAFSESIKENRKGAMLLGKFLKGLVQRRMSAKNVTGPIGMVQIAGDAAREGPTYFLGIMAAVSLQLAIFNLLPIPILDGGVILMLMIEMAMQRDLSMNVKEAVLKVGFVFIMLIVAFVVYNDIARMLPAG